MSKSTIAPEEYTRGYYEECCDGYAEFRDTLGVVLPPRLLFSLTLANVKPGMNILDIGCGRGELGRHITGLGAAWFGCDYASDGLRLARMVRGGLEGTNAERFCLTRASSGRLPYASGRFDRAMMLDVVEHLTDAELNQTLDDVKRVLKADGQLIIHTAPSLWYYRYGYPLYRGIQAIRGQSLPSNPRDRWTYSHVHINEQTPLSLLKTLKSQGFRAKVWLVSTQTFEYESSPLVRAILRFVSRTPPMKFAFAGEILAVARP